MPQAMHALLLQVVFACVQLPMQQGLPALPQFAHTPFVQLPRLVPHSCPLPRQTLPALQTPPPAHMPPLATHTAATQQPPPVQVLEGQQAIPGCPQGPPSAAALPSEPPPGGMLSEVQPATPKAKTKTRTKEQAEGNRI